MKRIKGFIIKYGLSSGLEVKSLVESNSRMSKGVFQCDSTSEMQGRVHDRGSFPTSPAVQKQCFSHQLDLRRLELQQGDPVLLFVAQCHVFILSS